VCVWNWVQFRGGGLDGLLAKERHREFPILRASGSPFSPTRLDNAVQVMVSLLSDTIYLWVAVLWAMVALCKRKRTILQETKW
ncbi:hypothetical protein LINGRAPRIM_LOCUS743, partial [Linum grandiflorum]